MKESDPFGISRTTAGLIEYRNNNGVLEGRLLLSSIIEIHITPCFGDAIHIILAKTERCPYEYETRAEMGWTKVACIMNNDVGLVHQEVRFSSENDTVDINISINDIDRADYLDGYRLSISINRLDLFMRICSDNPQNMSLRKTARDLLDLALNYMIEDTSVMKIREAIRMINNI